MHKAITVAVLGLAAAGLVSGCTSAKPAANAPKTETFASQPLTMAEVMANNTVFKLDYTGLVVTTGTFSTGGPSPVKGQKHTFVTKAGDLYAVVTSVPEKGPSGNGLPPLIDKATCTYGGTTKVNFKVTSGTGKFKGYHGTGHVAAPFTVSFPKKKGACNTKVNPDKATGAFDGAMRLAK